MIDSHRTCRLYVLASLDRQIRNRPSLPAISVPCQSCEHHDLHTADRADSNDYTTNAIAVPFMRIRMNLQNMLDVFAIPTHAFHPLLPCKRLTIPVIRLRPNSEQARNILPSRDCQHYCHFEKVTFNCHDSFNHRSMHHQLHVNYTSVIQGYGSLYINSKVLGKKIQNRD